MKFPPGWDHNASKNRGGVGTATTSASASAGDLARWKSSSSLTSMQTLQTSPATAGLPFSTTHLPSHEGGGEGSLEDLNVVRKTRMEKIKRRVEQVKKGEWEWEHERRAWAPLTTVMDPLITRTQWVIFVRSAAVSLVLSAIVACATLAVP
jgi:hypothetical protein